MSFNSVVFRSAVVRVLHGAVFLCCAAAGFANDSFVDASGGVVTPLKGGTQVRMVREHIRVRLPDCDVEARFVFRNDGPAKTVTIGFPEEGYNDGPLRRGQTTRFLRFASEVDGHPVRVAREAERMRDPEETRIWWVKRVRFARGQTRVIVNRYRTRPGGMQGDSELLHTFEYILHTGAPWKGTIGDSTVEIDVRRVRRDLRIDGTSKALRNEGDRLVFHARNFEPNEGSDLHVSWLDRPMSVRLRKSLDLGRRLRPLDFDGQCLVHIPGKPVAWLPLSRRAGQVGVPVGALTELGFAAEEKDGVLELATKLGRRSMRIRTDGARLVYNLEASTLSLALDAPGAWKQGGRWYVTREVLTKCFGDELIQRWDAWHHSLYLDATDDYGQALVKARA